VHAPFCAAAHADKLRYFRSLLVSSDSRTTSHRCVLRLVLALPPPEDMRAIGPFIASLLALVDVVGCSYGWVGMIKPSNLTIQCCLRCSRWWTRWGEAQAHGQPSTWA
jgi:hypothetical protein